MPLFSQPLLLFEAKLKMLKLQCVLNLFQNAIERLTINVGDEFYENIVVCHVRFGVERMDTMD